MKRYDLRHLKGTFYDRMSEIMIEEKSAKDVLIFFV